MTAQSTGAVRSDYRFASFRGSQDQNCLTLRAVSRPAWPAPRKVCSTKPGISVLVCYDSRPFASVHAVFTRSRIVASACCGSSNSSASLATARFGNCAGKASSLTASFSVVRKPSAPARLASRQSPGCRLRCRHDDRETSDDRRLGRRRFQDRAESAAARQSRKG